jgi:hypothetical protein
MKWTVIYRPGASDELAAIRLRSDDKQAITAAANSIDQQLRTDPLQAGESREGSSRVLLHEPLIPFFDVLPEDCAVVVWGLHHQ